MIVVDLYSQRQAFADITAAMTEDEKLDYLRRCGEVLVLPLRNGVPRTIVFRSKPGIESVFLFRENELVFLGDHTTLID